MRYGKGKYIMPNGNYYIGGVCRDEFQGNGTLYIKNGEISYKGFWINSNIAYNVTETKDGIKRLGTFLDNEFTPYPKTYKRLRGECKFYTYIGEVVDGKRHGYGINILCNGFCYVGEWSDDKRNGTGTYYTLGQCYKGEFRDDKENGHGTIYFSAGTIYYENGDKLECKFVDGDALGHGVLYKSDGTTFEGEWTSYIDASDVVETKNGIKRVGRISNGEFVPQK